MPTLNAAAPGQPETIKEPRTRRRSARFGRIVALALTLPVAGSFAVTQPAPVAAKSGADCSSWNSLTNPPNTIRVLRRKSGRIETVNFRKYVVTVMGKEWPSYLPMPVVQAGAVAVKQYAWYHAVYSSRSADGRCFDVRDGTSDQLYKPNKARVRPDHYEALDSTWNVSLRKPGNRFFMTGYRRGDKVKCGRDATGYKLFARSATQCAYRGHDWRQILRTYYGPGLDIVGSGGTSSDTDSASPTPDSQPDSTAQPTPETQPGQPASDSGAGRLSNGRWVDGSQTTPGVLDAGFGGSSPDGLGAALEGPAVPVVPAAPVPVLPVVPVTPVVPTAPTGPFQRLVVDPVVIA